jgi:hypothetical protein
MHEHRAEVVLHSHIHQIKREDASVRNETGWKKCRGGKDARGDTSAADSPTARRGRAAGSPVSRRSMSYYKNRNKHGMRFLEMTAQLKMESQETHLLSLPLFSPTHSSAFPPSSAAWKSARGYHTPRRARSIRSRRAGSRGYLGPKILTHNESASATDSQSLRRAGEDKRRRNHRTRKWERYTRSTQSTKTQCVN